MNKCYNCNVNRCNVFIVYERKNDIQLYELKCVEHLKMLSFVVQIKKDIKSENIKQYVVCIWSVLCGQGSLCPERASIWTDLMYIM